jgi:hypothetical protein
MPAPPVQEIGQPIIKRIAQSANTPATGEGNNTAVRIINLHEQ